jgi:uncharacterized membrane protein YhaH (DUF805 family)
MTFGQSVGNVYRNYATFAGRASRSEYWWWVLYSILTSVVIGFVEVQMGLGSGMMSHGGGGFQANFAGGPLSILWALANLLPGLAVTVRRLHDLDKSGWWLLIAFVPLIGAIVLLVWFLSRGTVGANRFGEDPLA